ncbi:MAG: enoyl-CoA hydratase [Granulosicoccus sp.]|jgi:enoyl-CoA hydratase/carnithine racemase
MSYVTVEKLGRAGVIGLDRPKALNALSLEIISDIWNALDIFQADPSIKLVILRSNHERAFCVGGDMRRISELSLAGHFDEAENFFRTEYDLNLQIASYPKPYVSLIDGICMGGGLGLSMHGRYRIATERAIFAMPDTAIGFFPDVGASYFLPRMPLYSGFWMGLGGARINKYDALNLGLSTHLTVSNALPKVFEALCHSKQAIDAILNIHCSTSHYQRNSLSLASVTYCFSKPTLCSMCECLAKSQQTEVVAAYKALRNASPRSLQETLTLLKNGLRFSLEDSLKREFEMAKRALRHPDLAEGVRSILVDKDHTPIWKSSHAFTPLAAPWGHVAIH